MIASVLGLSAAGRLAHADRETAAGKAERIRRVLGRMLDHEPITRILGRSEFWGLEFALSSQTLDPRPETETVVEAVLRRIGQRDRGGMLWLLDLGTGTGCLLLSLLSELPDAAGVGVDIEPGAAVTARANAATLGLAHRASFFVGDWATALARQFAVIVANPPYIPSAALCGLPDEVRRHDPRRALDGGADGLAAYRAIAADLPSLLAPGGFFVGEIGAGQADAAAALLSARDLAVETIEHDLAGIERCVIARRA
jgi:release factor glutamine methyltransferase